MATNTFTPTKELTTQEVTKEINTDYGNMQLNKVEDDSHFIAKIVGTIEEKRVPQDGDVPDKVYYSFPVSYEGKDDELEPVEFSIAVGPSGVAKFKKAYCDKESDKYVEEYIGTKAFFKKTVYKGNKIHSVFLIKNEAQKKKISIVKKVQEGAKAEADVIDTELATKFCEAYKGKFDRDKRDEKTFIKLFLSNYTKKTEHPLYKYAQDLYAEIQNE